MYGVKRKRAEELSSAYAADETAELSQTKRRHVEESRNVNANQLQSDLPENSEEEEEDDDEEDDDDENAEEEDDDDESDESDEFTNGKKILNEDEEFQLSTKYRELNKNLQEQRPKLTTDSGVSIVKRTLNEAAELFEGAKISSNTVLIATDSATLKEIGEQAKIATQNVKFGQSEKVIKFEEFASSWIKCFGTITQHNQLSERTEIPEYNWANAGLLFNGVSKKVNGCDFLLGPLGIEKKKRNIKARLVDDSKRTATKTANLKKADDVVNKDVKDDTSKAAERFFTRIKNYGQKISVFEAILNPTSFGKSIECMFVCSFLINNGLLLMNTYENDIPYLEVVNRENVKLQTRYQTNDDGKSHIIFSLDEDTWRKLVQVYQIKNPFFDNSDL
jgi:hypothetical protein